MAEHKLESVLIFLLSVVEYLSGVAYLWAHWASLVAVTNRVCLGVCYQETTEHALHDKEMEAEAVQAEIEGQMFELQTQLDRHRQVVLLWGQGHCTQRCILTNPWCDVVVERNG